MTRWRGLPLFQSDSTRRMYSSKRKELVLTSDFLGSYFRSYVGPNGPRDVQKYIEDGETIPLVK
jgi:hypothetical protein